MLAARHRERGNCVSSTLLSNSIMDVFDDLPHNLRAPPTECVFVRMVQTLLDRPDKKMTHAEFGIECDNVMI